MWPPASPVGAQIGAVVGTAIPIPVVGTAVGFVAGAVVGGAVGCVGNKLMDTDTGKAVLDAASKVVDADIDAAKAVSGAIADGAVAVGGARKWTPTRDADFQAAAAHAAACPRGESFASTTPVLHFAHPTPPAGAMPPSFRVV